MMQIDLGVLKMGVNNKVVSLVGPPCKWSPQTNDRENVWQQPIYVSLYNHRKGSNSWDPSS